MSIRESKLSRDFAFSIALIALLALFPLFTSSSYWIGVAVLATYFAIMATSWNLLGGYAGQFSLAPAAFAVIGAYSVALPYTYFGVPIWVGLFLAPLVGTIIGLTLGRVTLRLIGPYFALTTLGFGEIVRLLITNSYEITRGDLGLSVPLLTSSKTLSLYVFLAVLLGIVVGLFLFLRSKFGLYVEAIREDEVAAKARGVSVVFWRTLVFGISSAIGALGGALHATYLSLASPEVGLFLQSGLMIAMAVVGGMTTLSGPILGAIILYFASELLRDTPINYMVIFAAMIVLFARFMPSGLFSPILGLLHSSMRARATTTPAEEGAKR